jgi:hypothetical protein
MRARLLCAIGASLLSATTIAGQAARPLALSGELRTHVQNGRFDTVSSLNGLPVGLRGELQTLFGSASLGIVDPGAAPRTTRGSAGSTPLRRLVAAGCSYEDCLVYYERGGSTRLWRVVLIHWAAKAAKVEWGGTAPGGLTTIDEVRTAILSGAITSSAGPW